MADPSEPGIDWRSFASVFDEFSTYEKAPQLHEFYGWLVDQLDSIELEPTAVLEMGCGTGMLASKLVDWFPEARFELVDSSPDMLAAARELYADEPAVTIAQSDGAEYLAALPASSVDLAVFCRSWYAIATPEAAANLVRGLRPGGLVAIYAFTAKTDLGAMDSYFAGEDPERWAIARAAIEDFNSGLDSGIYRVFTEEEMVELWKAAGAEPLPGRSLQPESNIRFYAFRRPA